MATGKFTPIKTTLPTSPTATQPVRDKDEDIFTAKDLTQDDYKKIMMTGEPGTGKTRCIYELMLYDPTAKIFCINADLGGSGSDTIIQALQAVKREDLIPNYQEIEIAHYDKVVRLLYNMDKVRLKSGVSLWEWGPTWLVLEGFSNFQERLQDYVLTTFAPSNDEEENRKRPNPLRVEAFKAEMQDWGAIARGSSKHFDNFLRMRNPLNGQAIHKLITCYWRSRDDTVKIGANQKKPYEGPFIDGQFKNKILGGFDLVIRTRQEVIAGKNKFFYNIVKRRGYDKLPLVMEASFSNVLDVLLKKDYTGVKEAPQFLVEDTFVTETEEEKKK